MNSSAAARGEENAPRRRRDAETGTINLCVSASLRAGLLQEVDPVLREVRWASPAVGIRWRRWARGDAEARRQEPSISASLRADLLQDVNPVLREVRWASATVGIGWGRMPRRGAETRRQEAPRPGEAVRNPCSPCHPWFQKPQGRWMTAGGHQAGWNHGGHGGHGWNGGRGSLTPPTSASLRLCGRLCFWREIPSPRAVSG